MTDMMDTQKFPNLSKFSRATLFRHAKKSLDEDPVDLRHSNPGRPRLSSIRDTRVVCRQIKILRETTGTFSSKDLQASSSLSKKMSNLTFRRVLKRMGYSHRNTRPP